ncbi:UBP31 hydrolase, partial [Polypterus senegalus]
MSELIELMETQRAASHSGGAEPSSCQTQPGTFQDLAPPCTIRSSEASSGAGRKTAWGKEECRWRRGGVGVLANPLAVPHTGVVIANGHKTTGGFSTRPFVRSVQRQSLSSRSSVTSPLATNENGIKPSWSLSAKLQMRSNSPSRFSLDSFSSSTLERIGEATDDKVSTSCFGSYSKYEHKTSGKAPLAVMEGVMREENLNRSNTSLEDTFCKHSSQIEKRMSKMDSEDNNNRITSVDQSLSGRSLSTRESKHRSKPGPSNYKSDNGKRNPTKIVNEQDKSSKKRQISCSTQGSPASQASSSPSVKSSAKASGSKDKAESSKVGSLKPASSMSHSKKEHTQHQEGSHLSSGQQKQKHPSKLKSSSTLPVVTKTSSLGSTSSSGRNKMMEKSQSKESSLVSPHLEKPGGVSASKASSSARASVIKSSDSSRIERRPVRSSSSSSSVTSLRSPSVSSKTDLRRNSKSEDKGLSFFKSALRQKETRRSADFGKTSILSKKSTDGISKSTTKNGMDVSDGTWTTLLAVISSLPDDDLPDTLWGTENLQKIGVAMASIN